MLQLLHVRAVKSYNAQCKCNKCELNIVYHYAEVVKAVEMRIKWKGKETNVRN